MSAVLLFLSTFLLVACLAAQNLFVTRGVYGLAFINSVAIGIFNLIMFRLAPTATAIECAAFVAGGPFGAITAMWLLRRLHVRRGPQLNAQSGMAKTSSLS